MKTKKTFQYQITKKCSFSVIKKAKKKKHFNMNQIKNLKSVVFAIQSNLKLILKKTRKHFNANNPPPQKKIMKKKF